MKSVKTIFLKYLLPIVFFAILIFTISHKSFLNQSPIAYNDGSYYFNSLEKSDYIHSVYSDDYYGSNLSSTMFLRVIKGNTNITLKKAGLQDWLISYIMSFGLLYIVCLFYFFIFRNISQNTFFGYFAGIFVIFNNFTIESIAFGGFFYYSLGLISLASLLLIFFKSYENKEIRLRDIAMIAIASSFIILPIHLVIYSLSIILFYVYTLFSKQIKNGHLLILSGLLIAGIHMYWILPFIMNTLLVSSNEVYGGNASGVLSGYSKIANYINIISFRQYFNLISEQLFSSIFVTIYYLVLIILTVYAVFIQKNAKYKSLLLFFFIIYLIFFNISLGPNSYLTGGAFQYLWENVSIFHFFRSFTRFIIILIPTILLIFSLYVREKSIKHKYLSIGIIVTLCIHYPLLSGNLKGVIPNLEIPYEYSNLNNFLDDYKGSKNIIAYPNISYETYSWSISTSPKMRQDYYLKEYLLNSDVVYDRTSLGLRRKSNDFSKLFSNKLQSGLIENLERNSIGLVLVHKDYINIFTGDIFGYENFIEYFDSNSQVLIDNDYYTLYQVSNPADTLTIDEGTIEINKISSVEYNIEMTLNSNTDILRFYKNFDSNWALLDENNEEISSDHRKHNDIFNKWIINTDNLKKTQYTKNDNGTYSLKFKLYYKMQNYFILGKQISFWIICLTFLLLIIAVFKNKKGQINIS